MKRVAILVAAVAFTLSINTRVFATGVESSNNTEVSQVTATVGSTENETISEETNTDKGIMPDDFFYFLDKSWDNLKVFLTFDDEKKIEIISQIADERLAESETMTQEQKYDLAKVIVEDFNNLMNDASDKLNTLIEDNNNEILDKDKEMENTEVDLEHGEIKLEDPKQDKLNKLEKDILSKQLKSIEVLKKLIDKVDGNAKEAIQAVIDMQLAKKEAVANMVEKRHELNAARQEYQLAKIQLKQAKESGDEETIKLAEESIKEKAGLYTEAKEQFNIAFEEKKNINSDKKAEKKEIKEDKNVVKDNKLTEENKNKELNKKQEAKKEVKVANTKEKVQKDEIKKVENSNEIKKVEEVKKVKEEVERVKEESSKKEEVKQKVEQQLENKEIKHDNKKDEEKKVNENKNEKAKEKKENN